MAETIAKPRGDEHDVLQPVDEKPKQRTAPSGPGRAAIRLAGPAIALALIASAAVVLWEMVTTISLSDVERAIVDMAPWRILAAFACTTVGLLSLAAYDVVALTVIRSIPPISRNRAVVGGLVANIFANALGLPLLSGGSARYRIYSMVGAGLSVVGRLIVMSWVTMWCGILFVLGLTLMFEPGGEDPVFVSHLADRSVGALLVAALAVAVVWAGRRRRLVRIRGWTIRLPSRMPALAMILTGSVDLLAAAGTLYALLPPDAAPGIARYMVTYCVGLIAGIASNTPGGIGVFEAAIVTGLGIADRPDVAAALILFRVIYFVIPLVLALLLLGWVEWRHRRRQALNRRFGLPTAP